MDIVPLLIILDSPTDGVVWRFDTWDALIVAGVLLGWLLVYYVWATRERSRR